VALKGELLSKPTYTFLQTLYEGNTGVCYKCEHEIFGKPFVQKTISLLGLDDAVAYNEPRMLHSMRHANLVEIREAQWDPDPQWQKVKAVTFTMPYYEGGSVNTALDENYRFSLSGATEIIAGILAALHYLHVEQRVLHRDVKPGNVMLDVDRRKSYVGDLGSAAYMDEDGSAEARSGSLFYRPPEYRSGRCTVKSDLYGVGMIFFEMLNGPFPYSKLSFEKIERRLAEGKRPLPDRWFTFPPNISDSLARFVRSMISVDPSRRPLDAETARRSLLRLRFIDWEVTEPLLSGTRTWTGTWPPHASKEQARMYRVHVEPVTAGRYRGDLRVTAAWRRSDGNIWRGIRKLDRRIRSENEESELRTFFSDVAVFAAQQVAAK
jgi:eukaryotic-like serine/threonine-protein kinase